LGNTIRLLLVVVAMAATAGLTGSAWGQDTRPMIEVRPLDDPGSNAPARGAASIPKRLSEVTRGGPIANKFVVLQGLDKLTARVSEIQVEIGRPKRFGTLDIIAHTCRKRPPEEPPETTAFLEITEVREGEEPMTLFIGWMFASSPALSALEHAVYDVWVVDCLVRGD
jgi:hypothetical protein